MSPYQITFSKSAEKEILNLPKKIGSQILAKIDLLAINPRPSGCKKLSGSLNSYRIRIGDYRVIYTIADKELLVDIITIGDRKEVYR
jgi:mRNA interferase RelE/StbE